MSMSTAQGIKDCVVVESHNFQYNIRILLFISQYLHIHRMSQILTVFLCLLGIAWKAHGATFQAFEVSKAEKTVQLNGAYPIENSKIEYRCLISECGSKVFYTLPASYEPNLVKVSFGKDKRDINSFSHSETTHQHNGQNFILYEIDAGKILSQGDTLVIVAQLNFINRYVNFPRSIDLTEDQKFEYEDCKHIVSPYQVKESSITYKFSKILSYEQDGEKKGLSGVSFKAKNTGPFDSMKHMVHGVNNEPQVVFSEVERVIEVSHWGNIGITEFYKLKNVGPDLKGEFSRVKFSSQNNFDSKNAWKGIQTKLPYEIKGLYYRDEVGNISTSKAFRDHHVQEVSFAMQPRFALLGGWKSNFEIGYNLDTKGFLKHQGSSFELQKIPVQYALGQIMAEQYKITIILPESSAHTSLQIGGVAVDQAKVQQGVSFGYLDFSGRTTYTIPDLRGIFTGLKLSVSYNLEPTAIFIKPFRIFGAIFSVLLGIIILKRLNMSAFEDEPEAKHKTD